MMDRWITRSLACLMAVAATTRAGQDAGTEPFHPLSHLEWRNPGPVNMGGRVAAVEGVPGDPRIVYVGAAAGGVWKSEDGGISFKPVFDAQDVASIGAIALAPSNPSVVYVGTGEAAARNSVSPGAGVFKSTDAGKSWVPLGLVETRHVSRILVHPQDPDVVWVGALGHVFGPNAERGVFRSGDGGRTWEKTLFVDDRHGVADLDLDPRNPNVLFAALWRFERKPWTHTSGSEQGGVWRSVDGGRTWKKLTKGLPKLLGRIGVRVAPSDPRVVYVIAESLEGTLYRSDDGGDSFRKVSDSRDIVSRGLYYTQLRVHPRDADTVYAVASQLQRSIDGGKSFERISKKTHIDFHALWIDPANPERIWQGQDGGIAVSYDGGAGWEAVRNLPIGQFYQVYADDREPFYFLGGGLQDNGTWYGPSRTREPAGILEDEWRMPSFGDAFFVVPHPKDPDLILSESQGGHLMRTDLRTRQQWDVSPQPRRNDGGPVGVLRYRFNWNAPIVASPHDPGVVYFAGNVVFRTPDFGSTWETISPDLTSNDPEKQKDAGGPVWRENTTAEYHCTVISFAESPAQAGVLWAGTDDGYLQLSRDEGKTWSNVVANVKGLPAHSPVSHVEPSRTEPGTAWAAFDRHLLDDYRPYLFRTTDYGKTWTRLDSGLHAEGYVFVVRQDPKNPRLLWAGTERGLYASYDEGHAWQPLRLKNLPVVPVHDVLVHPRENDLILGTHGRALWIFDDATPLQQVDPKAPLETRLLPVRDALRFPSRFTRYGLADKAWKGANPPAGALISYLLPEDMSPPKGKKEDPPPKPRVRIEVLDATGKLVRTLKDPAAEKGVNRVAWDLKHDAPHLRKDAADDAEDFSQPPSGPAALPGRYRVRLTVDGRALETPVEVRLDPLVTVAPQALRAQHELAAALTGLRSSAGDALRGLDVLKRQLDERRQTFKALRRPASPELEQALAAFDAELKGVAEALARPEGQPRWSQGPRVLERLTELFSAVESAYDAPSAAQRAYFEELAAESREALARVGRFVAESLPRLNEALVRQQMPPLAAPLAP